ncbi:MAG: PQQ-dependent sugar dehydrogenase [Pseudomonadota bacterium]
MLFSSRFLGLRLVCGLLLLGIMNSAQAIPPFLTEWQAQYPNSNADDYGCQLCHQLPGGNQPWNAYGQSIRSIYNSNGFDITEAINIAGTFNQDGDPSGAVSDDEIDHHYQPGWTAGPNNTVTFTDGTQVGGQLPPIIPVTTTLVDPAIPTANTLPDIQSGSISLELQTVASGLSTPLMAIPAPGLPGFLFIVEQTGEIWQLDLADGSRQLFHDVGNLLVGLNAGFDERGLLGMAFHPNYINNGLFYTYQSEPFINGSPVDFSTMPVAETGDHQTVISEWTVINPAGAAMVSAVRRIILQIEQPQFNHNGGMLNFGPDGYLYISIGDGGSADDQGAGHGDDGNGRDNTNPLGTILRIDPNGSNSANGEYGIPADNPFVGVAGMDEIYAYGFRNPYRFSFDSLCFENGQNCNTLLVGDVGQGQVEEIDNVVAGGNYGWNWKEGGFFFYPGVASRHGRDLCGRRLPDGALQGRPVHRRPSAGRRPQVLQRPGVHRRGHDALRR